MKKVLVTVLIATCLVGNAQAALSGPVFDFDSEFTSDGVTRTLSGEDGPGAISDYMTAVYGSPVTVTGATVYHGGTAPDPLFASGWSNATNYIAEADRGAHKFAIEFAAPITAVSFNWARADDPFKVEAVYAGGTVQIFSVGTGETNGGFGWGYEEIDLLAMLGGPVTALYFHDGGQGAIGIDKLAVVSAVPLPTSVLLGVVAVGLAGRKLRRFA